MYNLLKPFGDDREKAFVGDMVNFLSLTEPEGPAREKELEEKEDIRHIQELIEQLPENQRQVIRLRGIEDCSYEDIEQITGLSSSNIRTLLSRARKLIREKLEKASCHG